MPGQSNRTYILFSFTGFFLSFLSFRSNDARAFPAGLPLDPSQYSNPSQLIPQSIVDAIVKTVGLAADERPYEPATPLGSADSGSAAGGLDLSLEVTLVHIPGDFSTALLNAGVAGGLGSIPPAIPLPRFHLEKGFGERFQAGGSYIYYQNYKIYGGEIQAAIARPEEGPNWALRLCYSNADIGFVTTQTWTPQLLVSKQLEFFDPYMGVGYQYTRGSIALNIVIPPVPGVYAGSTQSISKSSSAESFMSFLGLRLRFPAAKVQLTIEGAYDQGGAHTLGTSFGLSF